MSDTLLPDEPQSPLRLAGTIQIGVPARYEITYSWHNGAASVVRKTRGTVTSYLIAWLPRRFRGLQPPASVLQEYPDEHSARDALVKWACDPLKIKQSKRAKKQHRRQMKEAQQELPLP
jgi:hypothetical protein